MYGSCLIQTTVIVFPLQHDVPVEANFTDLAELISRIDEPRYPFAEGLNSDPGILS